MDVEFPSRNKSGWRAGDHPFVVADAIELASTREADFTTPLNTARGILAEDVEMCFLHEQAPDGTPWEEWSPLYFDRAVRENIGKLHKKPEYHTTEGPQLYEAVTRASAFTVVSRGVSSRAFGGGSVILNTSSLPYYWKLHQEGGTIRGGVTHKGEVTPVRIPARPFLGVTAEGEAAITLAIDMHVEGTLAGAVGKTGQPIFRLPGVPATFGPKRIFRG